MLITYFGQPQLSCGSPILVTCEKLVENAAYLSWLALVELWFIGQGYEDHLVTHDTNIPKTDCAQWK